MSTRNTKNYRNKTKGKKSKKIKKQRLPPRLPSVAGSALYSADGPMPETYLANLKFTWSTWVQGNTGNYVWSTRFRMNNVFDVDPAVSSGTVSGFPELAQFYGKYRVLRFRYRVEFANGTDHAIKVMVAPTKTDLGNNYADIIEISELPLGKNRMLSAQGGLDRCQFSGHIDLARYSGNAGYSYDDLSAAAVTGGPADVFYFNVGAASYDAQSATSIDCDIKFIFLIQFFERQPIEDVFRKLKEDQDRKHVSEILGTVFDKK